jgi:hypothetical protein
MFYNNSNRRPEGSGGNAVNDQAIALLKEGIRGKIPASKIAELRRKYSNDEMVDKIEAAFYERLNEINSKAKKFVKLVEKKFGGKGLPLHAVLKESKKYRDKYNLSDLEFREFKKQYEKLMNARLPAVEQQALMPNTNMARLFGDVHSLDGLLVRDGELDVLNDILKAFTMTRPTHANVILQSMQYNGCDQQVMSALYDSTRNNLNCAVNPVIAAFFVPKINIMESHFLFSNISYIVKCKYDKAPIRNKADEFLLHSMIIDSNDIVCSAETPLKDIRLRVNVQNNLWNCVHAMRNGKFFDCVGNDFFTAIDECKISTFDAPDLVYAGDEGVIMKRLLAAMSFNPLLVATNPVFGVNGSANPIGLPVMANRVVARSFLTLRLPAVGSNEVVTLENAISHSQVYLENGMFVPKTQTIIAHGGVLIFHVPRRSVAPIDHYAHLINPSPVMHQIPSHILINERINDSVIQFNPIMRVSDKIFNFVSAVILETPRNMVDLGDEQEQRNRIIVGTAAVVRNTENNDAMNVNAPYMVYSPKTINLQDPVAPTSPETKSVWCPLGDVEESAEAILATTGTIFVYGEEANAH